MRATPVRKNIPIFTLCIFFIAMFCVSITRTSADQNRPQEEDKKLFLKEGDLGPDETFIKLYYEKRERASYIGGTTPPAIIKHIPNDFYVGRHDINHDGKPELIVMIQKNAWCGTIGCITAVFHKCAGHWHEISNLSLLGAYVFVEDEPNNPWRTIYSYSGGYRWNGKSYDFFCIGKSCDENG
jgi:hypothetical protein